MFKFTHWRLALLLLISGGTLSAADWSKLKLGMSALETSANLGQPLLRTASQGFEVWIYDHEAEVVFYGPVVGWSAPRGSKANSHHVDVWQSGQSGSVAFAQVLPRPPQPVATKSGRRVKATKAKLTVYR